MCAEIKYNFNLAWIKSSFGLYLCVYNGINRSLCEGMDCVYKYAHELTVISIHLKISIALDVHGWKHLWDYVENTSMTFAKINCRIFNFYNFFCVIDDGFALYDVCFVFIALTRQFFLCNTICVNIILLHCIPK